MEWQTNPPTEAQLAKFDDQQAAQAGAQADRARDFYTRFSSDTERAAGARDWKSKR